MHGDGFRPFRQVQEKLNERARLAVQAKRDLLVRFDRPEGRFVVRIPRMIIPIHTFIIRISYSLCNPNFVERNALTGSENHAILNKSGGKAVRLSKFGIFRPKRRKIHRLETLVLHFVRIWVLQ
jgi:hypothetical protein